MEDKKSLLRNIMIILGFIVAVVVAFFVKANLPGTMSQYAGLVFYGVILLVGGLIAVLASKFIR